MFLLTVFLKELPEIPLQLSIYGEFFSKLVCISFFAFFVALFAGYSWVRKFLFLSKVANIVRLWGFDDDVPGLVWGVPRFRDILLGPAKFLGLGFLGYVVSRLLNLQRRVSFVF